MDKKHEGEKPCPNCGHCPTCGHTPQPVKVIPYPVYPYPYVVPQGTWPGKPIWESSPSFANTYLINAAAN